MTGETNQVMIVKVQRSIIPNRKMMLVYDNDLTFHYEGRITKDVIRQLRGRDKGYFHATIVGGELILESDAPDQPW